MIPLLAGYAFTALLAVLSLFLYVALKRELADRQRRAKQTWLELEEGLKRLQSELAALRGAVDTVGGTSAATGPPKPALNLNRRTQALRLHRQGQDADRIASALGMRPKEVELLIKVQKLLE